MKVSEPKAIVYIRDGCHLCDTLLEQLTAMQNNPIAFQIECRDIEDNPAWSERYAEYIPVVVVHDEEVCHYFLDQPEFESALTCQPT